LLLVVFLGAAGALEAWPANTGRAPIATTAAIDRIRFWNNIGDSPFEFEIRLLAVISTTSIKRTETFLPMN
jgi:hypothetical protein